MFRFAHPEYLYALYIIPVLVLVYWIVSRNKKKLLTRFAEKKLHGYILPEYSRLKGLFRFAVVITAIFLLVVAAANPQIGTKIENVKAKGIDVYICLDVSLSMQAEDIKPSRLAKAKYEISNLMSRLHGDRIGLIIFAGEPYIQFPLTSDYSAANLFLSAVSVNSIPDQGTAIAAALNLAVKSFDYKSKTEKVIVLITDGEDHEGDISGAIDNAKSKGIKIYTVGLGSPDGVPIPVFNQQGDQIGFKKDMNGNIVITKLDESVLKEIASQTGGKYFRASNYQDELELIYKDLSAIRKTEFGEKRVTNYEDRFYYFLAPALILLLVEFFITERKSPWFGKLSKKLGIEG